MSTSISVTEECGVMEEGKLTKEGEVTEEGEPRAREWRDMYAEGERYVHGIVKKCEE